MRAVAVRGPGGAATSGSFASVEPSGVMLSALKQAEDGGDLIVRCYEAFGEATHGAVTLHAWDRTIEADFGPHEIKTFRVPPDGPWREVSLLEE